MKHYHNSKSGLHMQHLTYKIYRRRRNQKRKKQNKGNTEKRDKTENWRKCRAQGSPQWWSRCSSCKWAWTLWSKHPYPKEWATMFSLHIQTSSHSASSYHQPYSITGSLLPSPTTQEFVFNLSNYNTTHIGSSHYSLPFHMPCLFGTHRNKAPPPINTWIIFRIFVLSLLRYCVASTKNWMGFCWNCTNASWKLAFVC